METSSVRVLRISAGATYWGVHPEDTRFVEAHFTGSAPYQSIHCGAFACEEAPVTKRRFLDWFNSCAPCLSSSTRENDKRFWDEVAENRGYDDDAPIIGVTVEEAWAFAWSHGGRLLFESEWLRLARGSVSSATSDLFAGSWRRGSIKVRDQFAHLPSLRNSTLPESWCGAIGVVGLIDELTGTAWVHFGEQNGDNYGQVGRQIVVTMTGSAHKFRILGARGCHRPYYILGEHFDVTARTIGWGFRVAFDWDTDFGGPLTKPA